MKKPEMEIVKFHNEDVIATSGRWSEKVSVHSITTYVQGGKNYPTVYASSGTADYAEVWMNSEAWNVVDPNNNLVQPASPLTAYSYQNTLDGNSISIDQNESEQIFSNNTAMHYRLDSHIGPWDNVYTVWETCGGTGCSHCYN